jgi:hypothetical protein
MKKFTVISIAILAMLCSFSLNASADGWTDGWDVVSCAIDDTDGMSIRVTDGTLTYTLFADDAVAGFENQAFAMCLSAKASTEKIDLQKFTAGSKFKRIRYHP